MSTNCKTASSVNMFKNRIDTYLRRAGFTQMNIVGLSIRQWLPCLLAIWAFGLDGKSCSILLNLPEDKQALAVYLTLSGTASETVLELPAADLNKNDGMTTLVGKLDKLFLKEAKEEYHNFDSFRKSEEIIMTDYIIEFEQRYSKSRRYEMALPDAVLALKLLDKASLTIKERLLELTALVDLTFASMKSALSRIFGDKST